MVVKKIKSPNYRRAQFRPTRASVFNGQQAAGPSQIDFERLYTRLLVALEPFPEARQAAVEALQNER